MSTTVTTQTSSTSRTTTSTTTSSATSSHLNITVTTSKIPLTSVTGELTPQEALEATSKSETVIDKKTSRFDVGSFVGGIVLTLGVLIILYIGCKTYHSRRGIQYRTINLSIKLYALNVILSTLHKSVE
ncbi:hypothetical protein Anapl_05633 [Anas platyrhynchos]|uniref:Porimin n=1 Tax=Anas platyrhynchos TaxID=8839 RepID=R0LQH5_ANAPL|nr:hypothetical protein Anapl_05633 [Anas platyrhynchos]